MRCHVARPQARGRPPVQLTSKKTCHDRLPVEHQDDRDAILWGHHIAHLWSGGGSPPAYQGVPGKFLSSEEISYLLQGLSVTYVN